MRGLPRHRSSRDDVLRREGCRYLRPLAARLKQIRADVARMPVGHRIAGRNDQARVLGHVVAMIACGMAIVVMMSVIVILVVVMAMPLSMRFAVGHTAQHLQTVVMVVALLRHKPVQAVPQQ